jgi:hypothetical protein
MMGPVTVEMVAAAAARLDRGREPQAAHAAFHRAYLVVWDPECRGRDYTGAVSAAQLWLKGFAA